VKSKYRIYVLLFFVAYSVQMRAMEAVVSESHKKWWHKACIHWALSHFLQKKVVPLSFEIIGSKKFIAQELRKKLDTNTDELIDLAKHRDAIFEVLKTCDESDHFARLVDSFKVLDQFIKPRLC
jgi:hypothetical protein